jgi:hypothetical protein
MTWMNICLLHSVCFSEDWHSCLLPCLQLILEVCCKFFEIQNTCEGVFCAYYRVQTARDAVCCKFFCSCSDLHLIILQSSSGGCCKNSDMLVWNRSISFRMDLQWSTADFFYGSWGYNIFIIHIYYFYTFSIRLRTFLAICSKCLKNFQ